MDISAYNFKTDGASLSYGYLMPALVQLLREHSQSERVFELGCGNGSTAAQLNTMGFSVTVIDPSASGHIKFFSRKTLTTLFHRVVMTEVGFKRVGRIPQLAKSMICVFKKDC